MTDQLQTQSARMETGLYSPPQFEGNRKLKRLTIDDPILFTPPSPPISSSPKFDGNQSRKKLTVDRSITFTPPSPAVSNSPKFKSNQSLKKLTLDGPLTFSPLTPISPYAEEEQTETSGDARDTSTKQRLKPLVCDIFGSDSPGSSSEEESPPSPYRGKCGGIKPPCFKLSAHFGEEPSSSGILQNVNGREFQHFINKQTIAVVMFYDSTKNTLDTLKVWARESLKQKTLVPDRAYGSVDCATETELCAREHIASYPLYKIYAGGYPVSSAKHFKLLNLD
ncbi:unnamed protein product [Candidula unifasciata]|uniref:Uncharacterized protein n=1 Tax=Candidula unifasciata TaxID=100452 RepID=A0A8S3ZZG6_9EUPU|nr:unnamed protein product [Candidula unifasciata]